MNAKDALALRGFDKKPELAKICRYIMRTDSDCLRKQLYSDDLRDLYVLAMDSVCDSVVLSYLYGQAKGYRTCMEKVRVKKE